MEASVPGGARLLAHRAGAPTTARTGGQPSIPGSAWPRTLVWAIRDVLAIGALMHHGRHAPVPREVPILSDDTCILLEVF